MDGQSERPLDSNRLLSVSNMSRVIIKCNGTGRLQWNSSTGQPIALFSPNANPDVYQRRDVTVSSQFLTIETFSSQLRAVYTCSTHTPDNTSIEESVFITNGGCGFSLFNYLWSMNTVYTVCIMHTMKLFIVNDLIISLVTHIECTARVHTTKLYLIFFYCTANPDVYVPVGVVYASLGDTVDLVVSVLSQSPPQWIFNNVFIEPATPPMNSSTPYYSQPLGNSNLRVHNVDESMFGEYKVQVTDGVTVRQGTVTLARFGKGTSSVLVFLLSTCRLVLYEHLY